MECVKRRGLLLFFFACWMNSWRTHISCKERAPSQLVSSSCHLPLFSAGNRPKSHGRIAWAWFNIRRRQRRFSTLISTSRQLGGANRNVIWYSNYSLFLPFRHCCIHYKMMKEISKEDMNEIVTAHSSSLGESTAETFTNRLQKNDLYPNSMQRMSYCILYLIAMYSSF